MARRGGQSRLSVCFTLSHWSHTHTHTHTQIHTHTDTHTYTGTVMHTHRHTQTQTDTQTHTPRHTQRHKHTTPAQPSAGPRAAPSPDGVTSAGGSVACWRVWLRLHNSFVCCLFLSLLAGKRLLLKFIWPLQQLYLFYILGFVFCLSWLLFNWALFLSPQRAPPGARGRAAGPARS